MNLFTFSLLSVSLLASSTLAVGQTTFKISSPGGAVMRQGATFDSSVLLTVPDQALVSILDKSNPESYHITYLDKTGYVAAYLVEESLVEESKDVAQPTRADAVSTSPGKAASRKDSQSEKSRRKESHQTAHLDIKYLN